MEYVSDIREGVIDQHGTAVQTPLEELVFNFRKYTVGIL